MEIKYYITHISHQSSSRYKVTNKDRQLRVEGVGYEKLAENLWVRNRLGLKE